MSVSLRDLETFGDVAAEDEPVLDYFVATEAVSVVEDGRAWLVVGRKGSGKTALVRYFTEGYSSASTSLALNLRKYPWALHSELRDAGASDAEAYVSSWRYVIATQYARVVLRQSQRPHFSRYISLKEFFDSNYGGIDPAPEDILRPSKLEMKGELRPTIFGNSLGSLHISRSNKSLGQQLEGLSSAIMSVAADIAKNESLGEVFIHFDELDQGLISLDESRSQMLTGLILATREVIREGRSQSYPIRIVVYLRSDIWRALRFSDKNKISQTNTYELVWDEKSMARLVDARIAAQLGEGVTMGDIEDGQLMRGTQTKLKHIMSRGFFRPRDTIAFLNFALDRARQRTDSPLQFSNRDISGSRTQYSSYLKKELDDEIGPHWPHWEEGLHACSAVTTITFDRSAFEDKYAEKRSENNTAGVGEALSLLYEFSVVGYRSTSGYGGSEWVFQYLDSEAAWDTSAQRLKVHLGLKEVAKLREERQS